MLKEINIVFRHKRCVLTILKNRDNHCLIRLTKRIMVVASFLDGKRQLLPIDIKKNAYDVLLAFLIKRDN